MANLDVLKSRTIHERKVHHIRYDIPSSLLYVLFEDEKKLEEFAEKIKIDFLYKLRSCAEREAYFATVEKIVERSVNNVCNKKDSQDV